MTFFFNPSFIIEIDPILDNLKSVSNDEEISMDDKIYTANDLLEQKYMARPTLESKTEYLATINQIFEQDSSYVFQITYDDGKDKVLTSIDLMRLLFKKKSTERPQRQNVGKSFRYTTEDFQNKKGKSKKKKNNTTSNVMTGRTIKRQSTEKIYALVAKRDTEGAKKVVIAEHNRCQKNILKFSKSIANAVVEAEQEIFNKGKFEYIDVVDKSYDHSKNVNYHVKEVQNDTLKEEKLFKKKQLILQAETKMMQLTFKKKLFKTTKTN